MRTRRAVVAAAAFLTAIVVGPAKTCGTSYDPFTHGEEGAAAPGAAVSLFHSGTQDVRRSIRVGDVLTASRQGGDGASRVAGKIRVVATDDAICFRGEVLEGSIRVHDLATGKGMNCLVVPEAVCGR